MEPIFRMSNISKIKIEKNVLNNLLQSFNKCIFKQMVLLVRPCVHRKKSNFKSRLDNL